MTHLFDEAPPVRRRTVVAVAGVTGLALAAPVGLRRLPDLLGLDAQADPAAGLTRADFAPHVGAAFTLRLDGERTDATLDAVEDLSDDLADDPDSFAVVLTAKGRVHQNTYVLERSGFAAAQVFLVPGTEGRAGRMVAVFDRRKGAR